MPVMLVSLGLTLAAAATGLEENATVLREVAPNVFLFEDTCSVYVIRAGDEAILIESGSGAVLDHLESVGVKNVAWVLHTHPHRDMTLGDERLIAMGAQIAVPASAWELFAEADAYWRKTPTYHMFIYGDKYEGPLRNIPVARKLEDGDTFTWKDVRLEVLDTAGHTDHHQAFVLERSGRKLVFSGDIIHSPGRLWEMDSLVSSYEEFVQAWSQVKRVPALIDSIQKVAALQPDLLLPAHGLPMENGQAALTALKASINGFMEALRIDEYFNTPIVETPEVQELQTCATQYLICEDDGHAVLIDAGFVNWEGYENLIERLKSNGDLKKIDIIIPTHYHSDHVASTVGIADHYGSKVYALDLMADILEEPHRFSLPCLSYRPIPVDCRFKDGESFTWKNWTFTLYHFPGQTYWHQAIVAEKAGKRFLFGGDSLDNFDHIRCIDPLNYVPISDTAGAMKCVNVMEKVRPHYIGTGHQGLRTWDLKYLEPMRAHVQARNDALRKLIAQPDPNMGYDIHWARMDPFHSVLQQPGPKIAFHARIRNHLPHATEVCIRPTLPAGWTAKPEVATASVAAKSEGSLPFTVLLPEAPESKRYVLGLDTTLDGQPYGEVGMAIVDIGGDYAPILSNSTLYPDIDPKYGYFYP